MKLNGILKESLSVNDNELKDEAKLMDFGEWDSMTHMYFITRLEQEYGVELTGDEIADMHTIADIKRIIVSKGKQL